MCKASIAIKRKQNLLWTKLKASSWDIITSKLSPAPNAVIDDWSNMTFKFEILSKFQRWESWISSSWISNNRCYCTPPDFSVSNIFKYILEISRKKHPDHTLHHQHAAVSENMSTITSMDVNTASCIFTLCTASVLMCATCTLYAICTNNSSRPLSQTQYYTLLSACGKRFTV